MVALSARRRTIQPLVRFLVDLALPTGVVYAFKVGVGHTAPIVDRLHAGAESYPSGHVPNAVLMGGLMACLAAEFAVPRVLPTLAVLRYVAPALVLAGMLSLDSHWLSDLVAGSPWASVYLPSRT